MAGDILSQYAASANFTCTLTGLGTSATKVAGRESTAIDNSSNEYLDVLVGGKLTVGTSPTGGSIDIYAYGSYDDTPDYPVNITGSDAAATMASENQRNAAVRLLASIQSDTTSDRTYSFGPLSLAQAFGGELPKFYGLWVTHNTGVNLNATATNFQLSYTPVSARYT